MPDPSDSSIADNRPSFSAPPAEVMRRSSMASSLNLADNGAPTPTNQPTFHDLLDVINPLQHIPGVSWLYRQVTGDTISAQARIVGDGIYGGVVGLVSGMFNALVEKDTGKDIASNIMALFDSKPGAAAATNVAAATSSTPSQQTANVATSAATTTAAMPAASAAPAPAANPAPSMASAMTPMPAVLAAALAATNPAAKVQSAAPTPATVAAAAATSNSSPLLGPAPVAGAMPQGGQPLSTDSQAALARLAGDLHASNPSGVTPASFLGASAQPAAATANGMPMPAKPVLAARAGGNNGAPSGMSLVDYRRWPVAPSNVVPLPSPPLAGVGTPQAAASYAQALELSRQLQNYYQGPAPAQPANANAPADSPTAVAVP